MGQDHGCHQRTMRKDFTELNRALDRFERRMDELMYDVHTGNCYSMMSARRHYSNTTVHMNEHRAPTDQSVALLREMEQAAKDNIVHTLKLEKNGFEAVVHFMVSSYDLNYVGKAIFDLNGKRMVVEESISQYQGPKALVQALMKKISEKIAEEVLQHAFDKADQDTLSVLLRPR